MGRNGRPVLPGFPWWSRFNWLMILTMNNDLSYKFDSSCIKIYWVNYFILIQIVSKGVLWRFQYFHNWKHESIETRPPKKTSSVVYRLSPLAQDWQVLGSSLARWGRGCALLKSPTIGRNRRTVLPGFPWSSSFNRLMLSIHKFIDYLKERKAKKIVEG